MRQKRFNGHAIPPFPARPQTYDVVDAAGAAFHSIIAIGPGEANEARLAMPKHFPRLALSANH
jgi:hypothetical protein